MEVVIFIVAFMAAVVADKPVIVGAMALVMAGWAIYQDYRKLIPAKTSK